MENFNYCQICGKVYLNEDVHYIVKLEPIFVKSVMILVFML